MNIYITVELALRELDSKLLLAVLAAAKGHQVIVSEQNIIKNALKKGFLEPGIFHSKSLTPNDSKIDLHQSLINNGFLISSIDEEGCLVDHGYDTFARSRYSDRTLEQSSLVFGWGIDDVETLKKYYPKYSFKIHKTGSPRADLWKSFFSDYWGKPKKLPKKPYLLVSSSMGTFTVKPFNEVVRFHKYAGYYQHDADFLQNQIGRESENYMLTAEFIKAIKYLAKKNIGYDIVLRPHPTENIEAWKISLENIPNVYVIREGSITFWVNNAFAVMHNGCTTAIEATFSKKPVITYLPFNQLFERKLANELGHRVKTLDQLLEKVNYLFNDIKTFDQKKDKDEEPLPENVLKKIYFDENELSSEKIIKLWESLDNDKFNKSSSLTKLQWFIKISNFKKIVIKVLKKILPSRFRNVKEDWKFPPLDQDEIRKRIEKLKNILKINAKLECKLLSNQTILIRKY